MNQEQTARLSGIGLTPELARRIEECLENLSEECTALRVVAVHRETLQLHDGEREFAARLLPWLARELAASGSAVAARGSPLTASRSPLAVGDWVLAARDEHAQAWVHARIEPVSHIARRDGDGRSHAVVSNVQTAVLVMGLDDDFNLRRLERFLALVHSSGVLPVVVLTKADLAADAQRNQQCLAALHARLGSSLPTLCVDARDPAAAQALQPWLVAGQTLVLLGSSGAGKSTLTNSLLGKRGVAPGTPSVSHPMNRSRSPSRSVSANATARDGAAIWTPASSVTSTKWPGRSWRSSEFGNSSLP